MTVRSGQIDHFILTPEDVQDVNLLIDHMVSQYGSAENEDLYDDIWRYTHKLPERVLSFVNHYKRSENNSGILVMTGHSIDDLAIGKTPLRYVHNNPNTTREELIAVLYSSLLGEVFGWAEQQKGRMINDILPVQGNEYIQGGSSSITMLNWHVEESFHPHRADYLMLFCLRNQDNIPTICCSIDWLELDIEIRKELFKKNFVFHPYGEFDKANQEFTRPSSVLFGSLEKPYLKIDPADMHVVENNETAVEALSEIVRLIENSKKEIVLAAGDICILDNYRVVHGRASFQPRYDGSDRWLKRVNVTRDIRRSRPYRSAPDSRVILAERKREHVAV
jgi:hypothetical protein